MQASHIRHAASHAYLAEATLRLVHELEVTDCIPRCAPLLRIDPRADSEVRFHLGPQHLYPTKWRGSLERRCLTTISGHGVPRPRRRPRRTATLCIVFIIMRADEVDLGACDELSRAAQVDVVPVAPPRAQPCGPAPARDIGMRRLQQRDRAAPQRLPEQDLVYMPRGQAGMERHIASRIQGAEYAFGRRQQDLSNGELALHDVINNR